ncbi:MAG: hypothetical protein IMZ44_02225, partial [Planctomycetes bacterium]|nr:hypothetical protein [Planctomycetota bacterium]
MSDATDRDWTADGHPSDVLLLCAVDAELPSDASARVAQHIDACWTCRAKVERLEEAIGALVEFVEGPVTRNLSALAPPVGFERRLGEEAERFAGARQSLALASWARHWIAPRRLRGTIWRLVAAGAALVLAVGVVNQLTRSSRVSANELIAHASSNLRDRLRLVPQPVIHQHLRVERSSGRSAPANVRTLEVWTDPARGRVRQTGPARAALD